MADPQKAMELAQPGDIILLMDGEYHRAKSTSADVGLCEFMRGGEPDRWIVLKNYPGQHPVLRSDGWNNVKIGRGSGTAPSSEPALAYLEVRGLHVRGNNDIVKTEFPDSIGKAEAISNTNGISVDGRDETHTPHHIRFADNFIELCCGGGGHVHRR